MELHFHPAVRVGVDLLTRRTDDDGGLYTLDERPGGRAKRPERHIMGDTLEAVPIRGLRISAVPFHRFMGHGNQQVLLIIKIPAVMVGQCKAITAGECPAVTGSGELRNLRFLLFHADFCQPVTIRFLPVQAGIVVNLPLSGPQCGLTRHDRGEIGGRYLEIVVCQRVLSGPDLPAHFQGSDDIFLQPPFSAQVIGCRFLTRAGLVPRRAVTDDHRVLAVFVLKKIGDSLLLHEP